MKKIEIPPILDVSFREGGINLSPYVFEKETRKISAIFVLYKFFLMIIKLIVKMRLNIMGSSYRHYHDSPHHEEVERIYMREAATYEFKHHKTTNFRDTGWRRTVAFDAMHWGKHNDGLINLLDIGTGVGLSIEEILRVYKLFQQRIKAVGIDYNQKMLEQAEKVTSKRMRDNGISKPGEREAIFLRADARRLSMAVHNNFFDCVTILCGIGGIDMPNQVFKEALSVLKPGGVLIMLDIHRPLFHLPEQWPWFIGNKYGTTFSYLGWEEITKPIVLGSLWGWHDPTQNFYTSQFATWRDLEDEKYYGFEKLHFSIANESWWFGLPVITTAKIILKKVGIEKSEFEKRNKLFLL